MKRDIYSAKWITEKALEIISRYEEGVLTIRGLHYQLVGEGMPNTQRHYKRVVSAMITARREGLVSYRTFSDRDREMEFLTEAEPTDVDGSILNAKRQISAWMTQYSKNRWENQPVFAEVLIEKKALVGTFERPCQNLGIGLGACKGYPSLTFLNDLAQRFIEVEREGKELVILYFGDYDPSGEDIPRSIQDNLSKDFGVEVEVRRIALLESQVLKWNLPPAPAKSGDSRTANWDGLGQVELDAVSPERLRKMLEDAVSEIFDQDLFEELNRQEEVERRKYVAELKEFVSNI